MMDKNKEEFWKVLKNPYPKVGNIYTNKRGITFVCVGKGRWRVITDE